MLASHVKIVGYYLIPEIKLLNKYERWRKVAEILKLSKTAKIARKRNKAQKKKRITEWLIEYNFKRPHETLNYETPMEFSKVLSMWSSCTNY